MTYVFVICFYLTKWPSLSGHIEAQDYKVVIVISMKRITLESAAMGSRADDGVMIRSSPQRVRKRSRTSVPVGESPVSLLKKL